MEEEGIQLLLHGDGRWDAKSGGGSVADWVMATKEEEGIHLLLHSDGDGMQNQKKVVSRMGTAMARLCK